MDWDSFEPAALALCDEIDAAISRRFDEVEQIRATVQAASTDPGNAQLIASAPSIERGP